MKPPASNRSDNAASSPRPRSNPHCPYERHWPPCSGREDSRPSVWSCGVF